MMDESQRLVEFHRYEQDGGNRLITEGLGLGPRSVVVEFGGHVGNWAADILRYGCRVQTFEPVPAFASTLDDRFARNDRVTVHPFALGAEGGVRTFGLSADGTGRFASYAATVPVLFRPVTAYRFPDHIDLMAINIEGGEYELIPALRDVFPSVARVLVQFHLLGDNPDAERERCRDVLSRSHSMDWCYDFVWESWC
jgi:FkbM family methyltransferase